jgi:hypothetical protein
LNLELVNIENGTGNGTNVVLKAPDGFESRFMVSRSDDPHSDRQNINQMRHFARDHQASRTLPGFMEIEMLDVTPKRMSNVEMASMAVVNEHNPRLMKKIVQRVGNDATPLNLEHAVINGASRPQQQEIDIPVPLEVLEKLITRKAKMPATKLTLAKTPSPKTMPKTTTPPDVGTASSEAPAKPKSKFSNNNKNKLGQANFFRVCQAVMAMDMTGLSTYALLTERLKTQFDFPVPQSTLIEVMKVTGKTLHKPVKPLKATPVEQVIARTLTALLIKLSEPVPEELRAICGEIE